jgi:hypothetical protein
MLRLAPSSAAPALRTRRSNNNNNARLRVLSAASSRDPSSSLQLATARLPAKADRALFARTLFNWSASITQNGRNMPLSLPLHVDRAGAGEGETVTMSLLRVLGEAGSPPVSVADLVLSIEDDPSATNGVLVVVRLFEGPGAAAARAPGAKVPSDARERIEKVLLPSLPDVDVIMTTMKNAIGVAAQVSLGQR